MYVCTPAYVHACVIMSPSAIQSNVNKHASCIQLVLATLKAALTCYLTFLQSPARQWCWTPCSTLPCRCGDIVRVSPNVSEPLYSWGSVTHSDIGRISESCHEVSSEMFRVDFPAQMGWTAERSEMLKRVECSPSGVLNVCILVYVYLCMCI
jgi:hypothetical protein